MQLAVVGLNHNTAPVEVRETLAVADEMLAELYKGILTNDRIYEAMVISTCNRVEYYIVTDDFLCNVESVLRIVSEVCGISREELQKYTYIHCGSDSVKHIFRVASGLDSLVLGEPQIFGQVKDAFENARKLNASKTFLRKLEEYVIKTTKRIRTHTGIGDNPVSVSSAAVELAEKIFGKLEKKAALIIGAGEMCEIACKHLISSGIGELKVTNRTFAKAQALAESTGGKAVPMEHYKDELANVDIVLSSTGAPCYMVESTDIKKVMAKRKYKPMFLIDIAVPRDIDPAITDIENAYVYDIDDLKAVVESNKKLRQKEAQKAMEYVESGLESFYHWVESMKIVPVIKSLREYFDDKKYLELNRFCDKFKVTDKEERRRLEYLLSAYMNKALHTPLNNLKDKGPNKGKYTLDEALEIIFDLKDS
ncbi:glutamyl-tRNA reductase [Limisalsivibrio acetivorans]|uniref:glutamyl-tRNA reductase n=1 Tax=Limisalsivibrio acetivorans TaxID=1304888 RepID=UPI0003B2F7DA|nr:glutamyl-tRNA reductase [Limisalsivibrio acetivorans]